jgi:uncharacterized repeat protein (TIGR04138 family)
MKKSIEEIANLDGRYSPRAFELVLEGLSRAVKQYYGDETESEAPHHVTGKTLCFSLAELATEKWGYLAKIVLNQLGVKSTFDFGNIVYLLVEHNWMYARPEDSIDEFKNVYDFEQTFEKNFQFSPKNI